MPLGKDGGVRNAEVSTLSAIPLSQFRYAHCQLPLGRGAFRPRAKLSNKPQFIYHHLKDYIIQNIFQQLIIFRVFLTIFHTMRKILTKTL